MAPRVTYHYKFDGAALRRLREAAGITQKELARRSQMEQATISRLEVTRGANMLVLGLCNLAYGLGLTPAEFFSKVLVTKDAPLASNADSFRGRIREAIQALQKLHSDML